MNEYRKVAVYSRGPKDALAGPRTHSRKNTTESDFISHPPPFICPAIPQKIPSTSLRLIKNFAQLAQRLADLLAIGGAFGLDVIDE